MHRTLQALDEEWRGLAATESSRKALHRWAGDYPALAGLPDLDGVLDRRRNADQAAGVLAALAALAPDENLAARVLLQALLPGIVCMAATAGSDDPAAIEEMLSLAWERIRTYPTTRNGSVAGNVLLDVRKRYRRHRDIEAPKHNDVDEHVVLPGAHSPEDIVMAREELAELAEAQKAGVVRPADLQLIVRTRLGGEELQDVAEEMSVNVHCLTQRRWRAEQRLRTWLKRGA
jgi:DNA-directed RNA polymerase specialized sigma24 family protein